MSSRILIHEQSTRIICIRHTPTQEPHMVLTVQLVALEQVGGGGGIKALKIPQNGFTGHRGVHRCRTNPFQRFSG